MRVLRRKAVPLSLIHIWHIVLEERGSNGFGYDPLFVPLGYSITFGEFPPEEKNKISHRANALRELRRLLEQKTGEKENR